MMAATRLGALVLAAAALASPARAQSGDANDANDANDAGDASDAGDAGDAGDAAPPAAADDLDNLDLAALGVPTADENALQIYGFADMLYAVGIGDRTKPIAAVFPHEQTFVYGNLNVYLTKHLATRWRSMVEVRFTFAPNGVPEADGNLTQAVAPDPADAGRPISWGGVVIERAYLEYDLTDWLTLQAGVFLTPYGIWNVDHGSPAYIPTLRPYIIGEDLFPEQQTGLHLYGSRAIGESTLGYHATFSNGRGPFHTTRDLDDNKAIGGRVVLTTPWHGELRVGFSAYRGRFTDRDADQLVLDESGAWVTVPSIGISYDEVALAADVRWQRGPLLLQAEILQSRKQYRPGQRPAAPFGGFLADEVYSGSYLIAGYRLARWWNVMPFVLFELDHTPVTPFTDHSFTTNVIAGLNFRPNPNVVLKLNVSHADTTNSPFDITLTYVVGQAAWVF